MDVLVKICALLNIVFFVLIFFVVPTRIGKPQPKIEPMTGFDYFKFLIVFGSAALVSGRALGWW